MPFAHFFLSSFFLLFFLFYIALHLLCQRTLKTMHTEKDSTRPGNIISGQKMKTVLKKTHNCLAQIASYSQS